jgi:hypothetical protein
VHVTHPEFFNLGGFIKIVKLAVAAEVDYRRLAGLLYRLQLLQRRLAANRQVFDRMLLVEKADLRFGQRSGGDAEN